MRAAIIFLSQVLQMLKKGLSPEHFLFLGYKHIDYNQQWMCKGL